MTGWFFNLPRHNFLLSLAIGESDNLFKRTFIIQLCLYLLCIGLGLGDFYSQLELKKNDLQKPRGTRDIPTIRLEQQR